MRSATSCAASSGNGEEGVGRRLIALAHLAQHPADSLVNQVMPIVEQEPRDLQRGREYSEFDVVKRREDSDPTLPHDLGPGELHERPETSATQVAANNVLRRAVDQIPVVDEAGVFEIQPVNALAK